MSSHPVRRHSPPAARPDSALVIFAKAPIPGQVKTRLCPPLTHDEAATLQGSFVLDALERTNAAVAKFKLPLARYLACAPSSALPFFKIMEARQAVSLVDQIGADLGERMHAAFETMFGRGYRKVVLVGTDVPTVPLDYYRDALSLLRDHDAVFGPALDGGYYLVGLTKPAPDLFAGVPWSTDRVLAVTRDIADRLGLRTALLPEWRDVDTIDDLRDLIAAALTDSQRPAQSRQFSSRTAGVLQLLAKRLPSRHNSGQ
ncbi:MAG TPA: TIGR04282 family arsenosugar biosynthesis glycosyltransferase [Nitrospira sp.]|nr:TIGR04282 family arsenosugar biosynthesis glycosyltransferase [Nitrospira sp.]